MSRQRTLLPWDDLPPLPVPDQSRYGPTPATPVRYDHERELTYREEGGGVSATCLGCGWLTWAAKRPDTERAASSHTCPKKRGQS